MMMTHLAAIVAALCLFSWLGLRARRTADGLDDYMTARNSQGATTIGLSFLASGMGAWILFAPPEVGAFVGPVALAGYALGAALPFVVFAMLGPLGDGGPDGAGKCRGVAGGIGSAAVPDRRSAVRDGHYSSADGVVVPGNDGGGDGRCAGRSDRCHPA